MSIKDFFFPPKPRGFPGRRALKIGFRGLHVLCAGVLTGSHIFSSDAPSQVWWLQLTLATAAALLLLDLHESGVFLLQVRGYFVILKLAALGLLSILEPPAAAWLLGILLFVSVLSSHAPSRVRYHVPLGGGVFRGARTKG